MRPGGRAAAIGASVALVLGAAGCGSGTTASTGTGPTGVVSGVVRAGPTCPVERAGSPCPPLLVSDAVVQLLAGARVVAATTTDAAGHFLLRAAPGGYVLRVTSERTMQHTADRPVTVAAGRTVTVRVELDTGIR